jgi:hypothetical protein
MLLRFMTPHEAPSVEQDGEDYSQYRNLVKDNILGFGQSGLDQIGAVVVSTKGCGPSGSLR